MYPFSGFPHKWRLIIECCFYVGISSLFRRLNQSVERSHRVTSQWSWAKALAKTLNCSRVSQVVTFHVRFNCRHAPVGGAPCAIREEPLASTTICNDTAAM